MERQAGAYAFLSGYLDTASPTQSLGCSLAARGAHGHPTAALPSAAINSRRFSVCTAPANQRRVALTIDPHSEDYAQGLRPRCNAAGSLTRAESCVALVRGWMHLMADADA